MQEDHAALESAIASGDTDLIYFALLHIKRKRPLPELPRTYFLTTFRRTPTVNAEGWTTSEGGIETVSAGRVFRSTWVLGVRRSHPPRW